MGERKISRRTESCNLVRRKSWTWHVIINLWLFASWPSVEFLNGPYRTSLAAQMVKNPLSVQEMWAPSLGQVDPLRKKMAIHSSIPAWEIPWTEEPGRFQSTELQYTIDLIAMHSSNNNCKMNAGVFTIPVKKQIDAMSLKHAILIIDWILIILFLLDLHRSSSLSPRTVITLTVLITLSYLISTHIMILNNILFNYLNLKFR